MLYRTRGSLKITEVSPNKYKTNMKQMLWGKVKNQILLQNLKV